MDKQIQNIAKTQRNTIHEPGALGATVVVVVVSVRWREVVGGAVVVDISC